MDKEKKNKILKMTGLIVLTVLVILSVFLTIFFVNKSDKDNSDEIINTEVSDKVINTIKNGSFMVLNVHRYESLEGLTLDDGNIFMAVTLKYSADDKDIKVRRKDFNMSGFKPVKKAEGYLDKDIVVKKGETKEIKVLFEIKRQFKEYYLYCYNYRVRVGVGDIINPIG